MTKSRFFKTAKKMPTLITDRLVMRKLRNYDYRDMYEYSCQSSVTKYLLWCEHPSPEYTYNYLSGIEECYKSGDFYDWAITLKDSGKMIGTCGYTSFDYENGRAEVGYVINPEYWGQGVATEAVSAAIEYAFNELNVNRVEAHFIKGNNASLRVMEKCGMTFEGYLRQYMLVKGSFKTIGFAAVTKDEYVFKNAYKAELKKPSWFPFAKNVEKK